MRSKEHPPRLKPKEIQFWGEQFVLHERDLMRILYSRVQDIDLAEDLVQVTFQNIMRKSVSDIREISRRDSTYIKKLLRATARNAMIDYFRTHNDQLLSSMDDKYESLPEGGSTPEQALEKKQSIEMVRATGARMTDDQREVLRYLLEGRSTREIAGLMHKSYGATRALLMRCRISLKSQLPDRG